MSESMGYMRLIEAFQYVSDELLDIVEQEKRKKKKKPMWRVAATVAACICVLLLPVGVMAARWFGLWDLLLPRNDNDLTSITVAQYHGSPEVAALNEWQQFLAAYDIDGIILSEAEELGFAAEGREDWPLYGVYSYDMGEMLDKIAYKHGLVLHTSVEILSFEELQSLAGGSFIEDASIGDCQVYENGSFYLEGETELNGCGNIVFRLNCAMKGTLDITMPNMRNEDGHIEWQYDTACGESARLGLGTSNSLILKGVSDRYITVFVPYGSNYGLTKENLQELADKIDFGVLMDMQMQEISSNAPASNVTLISIIGNSDSAESQALAEWNEFLAHYDADRKIRDEIGNGVFVAEGREDWSQYSSVYSYEMGEKLDEIAEKYGLRLHTDFNVIDQDELMYRVGGEFMNKEYLTWAYIYEDGTFHVEGRVELAGSGRTGFQFDRTVKGTFNDWELNIGRLDDYTEWQYITACGELTLLELGSYKALIVADFEDCFIVVNVLLGSEEGMTKEDLQEFAEIIDFKILKDVQVPDMRGDSVLSKE